MPFSPKNPGRALSPITKFLSLQQLLLQQAGGRAEGVKIKEARAMVKLA